MTDHKTHIKIISLDRRLNDCKTTLGAVKAQANLDEERLLEHVVELQERLEHVLSMNEYYKDRLRKANVRHRVVDV
jgi:hypothetical protein